MKIIHNYFKALRLVGGYYVVEGFWRTLFTAIGLVGMAVFLLIAAIIKEMPFNWITMSLILVLGVMATLPMYLPRREK